MRNSDPRVSIVSVQRPNSDLNSIFTVQITGCNFYYGPNLCVPLDPSFWLWWLVFSWKSVFTTSHYMKQIVRDLQCLSSWSLVQFQQHSEILHPYKIYSICLVVTAFQFVLHLAAIEDLRGASIGSIAWPFGAEPVFIVFRCHASFQAAENCSQCWFLNIGVCSLHFISHV